MQLVAQFPLKNNIELMKRVKDKNIINRQFNEYFVIFKDVKIDEIIIQPEEVEEVLYYNKNEILDKIRNHKDEMCTKDMAWKILEMYYKNN